MPINAVQQGEVFTVRVYKQIAGFAWANTYEVQAVTEPPNSITAVEALANAFAALDRAMLLSSATVDRVVVSTYVPDGLPYNPDSFTSIPISLPGLRSGAGQDPLPLEACVFVRRNAPTGRDGRLLYRGYLLESDVTTSSLRPYVAQQTLNTITATLNTWFTSTFPSSIWSIVMARGRPNPTNVRIVTAFIPDQRVVYKKLNNRYFDRP
jgi:hypothetical protein